MRGGGAADERFWRWFAGHRGELALMLDTSSAFWDVVLAELKKVDPSLWFEISGDLGGRREFVVTAEGRTELFETVDRLVAAAPDLEEWRFVALKPGSGFGFVSEYEGRRLDPNAIWFVPLESASDPQSLGVRVGVPGYDPADRRVFESAVLMMLDTGLGEREAATQLDVVQVGPLPADPPAEGYIELPELPAFIRWWRSKRG